MVELNYPDTDGSDRHAPILSIVVPCYNEEPVIEESVRQLVGLMETLTSRSVIDADSFIVFVDDGSSDRTWELLGKLVRFIIASGESSYQ